MIEELVLGQGVVRYLPAVSSVIQNTNSEQFNAIEIEYCALLPFVSKPRESELARARPGWRAIDR